ncbi:hypothetical protein ROTAS13_04706 [Roseomonas sp. TAS13]|nr:hypothetical protein ROTAS13_04706 [Roseomonas sp. TAS13]
MHGVMRGELAQAGPAHLLEALGQLPRHRRRPVRPQPLRQGGQGLRQPVRRFVEDQRRPQPGPLQPGDAADLDGARRRLGRKEAVEQEGMRRQAGQGQCHQRRVRPGNRGDRQARIDGGAGQAEARIAHQRRAGIGNQGQPGAAPQPFQQPGHHARLVVVVQGDQTGPYPLAREHGSGHPGVLAQDGVRPLQGGDGPWREVAQVADRGGHQNKARKAGAGAAARRESGGSVMCLVRRKLSR